MPDIHTVAILGAGAMGAYFAACFHDSPDFTTVLVAEGERLERLNRDGLWVNDKKYSIPAVDPRQAAAPADLILVALKHHQLAAALESLAALVGPQTVFVSVMNGLESEELIAARFGWEKVLYAVSVGIDAVRIGNRVTLTQGGTHYFGEARNTTLSPNVLRVQSAFQRAGIRYEIPPDMLRMLWWKFMVNVGVNQASAVMRAKYGVFQTHTEAQGLMEALMLEVVTLAQASGVNLTSEDVRNWYPVLNKLSPQGKTSMLQDMEAGRKTEVDVFGGKVVALGQALNIPTPVNRSVAQIIRVLEDGAQAERG